MNEWLSDMSKDVWYSDTSELKEHRNEVRQQVSKLLNEADNEKRIQGYQKLLKVTGSDFFAELGFNFSFGQNISVGDHFYANKDVLFLDEGAITIGDNCFFGPRVQLLTPIHPIDPVQRRTGVEKVGPITIGNDVWFGGGAIVLPNVTIGNNVVVGAGAVVTNSVPDNVVVAGNPGKVIKVVKS